MHRALYMRYNIIEVSSVVYFTMYRNYGWHGNQYHKYLFTSFKGTRITSEG